MSTTPPLVSQGSLTITSRQKRREGTCTEMLSAELLVPIAGEHCLTLDTVIQSGNFKNAHYNEKQCVTLIPLFAEFIAAIICSRDS